MTPFGGDPRDLRRLYITEASPEETEDEARAVAMCEVASMFPGVVVTGVHRVERRRGGWYAVVTTRDRTRENRKQTMPTHSETRTRATTRLDPLDSLEEDIREIRELSQKVLDDSEALLVLVGEPESADDAAAMLDALRTAKAGGEPASDEEAAIVAMINEFLGEPITEKPPDASPTAALSSAGTPPSRDDAGELFQTLGAGSEAPVKRCSKCDTPKALDEFRVDRRSKDGRASQCKECRRKAERRRYQSTAKTKGRDMSAKKDAEDGRTGDDRKDRQESSNTDSEATSGKPPTGQSNGHAKPPEDWREHFENPTLDRLDHLRAFLGGVTFDETVRIVREITVDASR